jgi:hypothetical protein
MYAPSAAVCYARKRQQRKKVSVTIGRQSYKGQTRAE